MRRARVAVVGAGGLFEDSVAAALVSKRIRVRRFTLDDQDITSDLLGAFEPDVVVVVAGTDQPAPRAALAQMGKGVAIVTLDPVEPTMGISYQVRNPPTTLESVISTVRAARAMLSSNRTLALTPRGRGGDE